MDARGSGENRRFSIPRAGSATGVDRMPSQSLSPPCGADKQGRVSTLEGGGTILSRPGYGSLIRPYHRHHRPSLSEESLWVDSHQLCCSIASERAHSAGLVALQFLPNHPSPPHPIPHQRQPLQSGLLGIGSVGQKAQEMVARRDSSGGRLSWLSCFVPVPAFHFHISHGHEQVVCTRLSQTDALSFVSIISSPGFCFPFQARPRLCRSASLPQR